MSLGSKALSALCAGLVFAACPSGPSSSRNSASGRDEAATVERRIAHIEGLLARRSQAAAVLGAIIAALPARAWIVEAGYDGGKVRLKGNAPTNNLVADYVARLEQSPVLTGLTLGGSVMKTARGREYQEFSLTALAAEASGEAGPAGEDPAARLARLERSLPAPGDPSETLRELQRLAADSGLQMTKFGPGVEIPGELISALPVTIEVSGEIGEVARYLDGLAALPRLWIVEKLAVRSVRADDPRAAVRASITARAHFVR